MQITILISQHSWIQDLTRRKNKPKKSQHNKNKENYSALWKLQLIKWKSKPHVGRQYSQCMYQQKSEFTMYKKSYQFNKMNQHNKKMGKRFE